MHAGSRICLAVSWECPRVSSIRHTYPNLHFYVASHFLSASPIKLPFTTPQFNINDIRLGQRTRAPMSNMLCRIQIRFVRKVSGN